MKLKIFFVALLCAAHFTQAQEWTGAVNTEWNNPANWNGFPTNGDDISISVASYSGAMANPVISTNSVFSPAEMLVEGGAILTINANLTTTDRVEVIGIGTKVILNSGILNISGGAGNARFIFSEESQLIMSGGTLNVGQRLLFELGASGLMSNGTIDITETFALIDGFGSVSSSFTQSGGVIDTEGFGFENEAGNFHPIYRMEDGVLNVNGDFLVDGASPGAGIGEFYATEGNANFYGAIGNIAGSTMNYTLRFEGNSMLNMSGAVIDQLPGDSIVISNGGTMNVNANLVWNNAGVVDGENGEVVINSNTVLNGAGIYQYPYLTVLLNKSLSQVEPEVISINGDFVLSGNYNQLNHSLEFNGDSQQDFSFVEDQVLDALIMNNTGSGVTAYGNIIITDSLKWINGVLDLQLNQLTFNDEAISLLASENSYAIGEVIKKGNDAFVFPVGSVGNRYRPLGISAPISGSTEISVVYFPEAYLSTTQVNSPLQTVSSLEYWSTNRTGSNDFVTLNVAWNNASESGLIDCASISLAHWDNSIWNMIPSVATGICSGTGSGELTTTADISDFGIYTIGFTEGVFQQAVTVCYGETFTVGLNEYGSSGTYFDQFTDSNGDDSLVVTALTVLPQLDLSIQNNVTHLISNAESVSYQWLDCANGFTEISGAQSPTYYPNQNGIYAVLVELNGCVDTSECVVIDELSIDEQNFGLQLFPNPVQYGALIHVQSSKIITSIVWLAPEGEVLDEDTFPSVSIIESIAPAVGGWYMIMLNFEDGSREIRKVSVIN